MTVTLNVSKILGVPPETLEELDENLLRKISDSNNKAVNSALKSLNLKNKDANSLRAALRGKIFDHERELLDFLEKIPGAGEFEKAVNLAKRITSVKKGFFLKKEYLKRILKERPAQKLLDYLNYESIDELVAKENLTEVFSSLRFIESEEWMHETFEKVYSSFTAADFEERAIELEVLSPKWLAVSKKFIVKKHHNVSHLKEFGVIFLNPVRENVPGKFLRDFALLLHYFHEINFYSNLFKEYSGRKDFSIRFKSLLRGDVLEVNKAEKGVWLIVQQYLAKINPKDPRLSLPRVNPESIHWRRAERDLANFGLSENSLRLEFWQNLDWVAAFLPAESGEELVSFDLEDNAMSAVSFKEGRKEFFTYHQREAMWTRIFEEYVGGEEKMEEFLIENFDKGIIRF